MLDKLQTYHLGACYINPKGNLYKDYIFSHWSVCHPIEGVESIELHKNSLEFQSEKQVIIIEGRMRVRLDFI